MLKSLGYAHLLINCCYFQFGVYKVANSKKVTRKTYNLTVLGEFVPYNPKNVVILLLVGRFQIRKQSNLMLYPPFVMTSSIVYQGELRTEALHLQSGTRLLTDAPTDNQGKGAAFSPTDLVATALASCMMTIMGIVAQRHDIELIGSTASVTKQMQSNPRKIASIEIVFHLPTATPNNKRALLERAAHTCPVSLSLDKEVRQIIVFCYDI